nr:hypothetical protein [Chlorogloeopsis fritschii]
MLSKIFFTTCAWGISILSFWTIVLSFKKGMGHLKRLHQIPCSGCEYFTNDYRLKCTVHPINACTEEAIDCRDFEPKNYSCKSCQNYSHKLKS